MDEYYEREDRLYRGTSTIQDRFPIKKEVIGKHDFEKMRVTPTSLKTMEAILNNAVDALVRERGWHKLPELRVHFDVATRIATVLWEDET